MQAWNSALILRVPAIWHNYSWAVGHREQPGIRRIEVCEAAINQIWQRLEIGRRYQTPDNIKHAEFEIADINDQRILIAPQNIHINRRAFVATLDFLRSNNHSEDNPCIIGSSNDPKSSGELCTVSRSKNDNVRCINYILPILEEFKVVTTDGSRPNRVWLTC